MTGIEGIGWPTAPRVVSRAPAKSGFVMPSEPDEVGHAAASPSAEPVALGSMLTLQELGGESVADRQARRHGQDMLAELAALQRALLAGGADVAALHHLAELAAAVPRSADRRLAAMVSAIVVRVRVELARRQG
jgi:hypothetical protein